jgi:hypothetical protein
VEFRVWDVANRQRRLLLEMATNIRFAHGSDRVTAHRMSVDAMDSSVGRRGEQTTFEDEPTKMRRADDNRHKAWMEGFDAQLDGPSDAAMPR